MLRGSIANNITGNPIATDRIVQSIGLGGQFNTACANFVLVKGVYVYQNGSTAKSLKIVRHNNDQLTSSTLDAGRWCYYNNAITTNTQPPRLITWSTQPSVIAANPLASATLGPNVGDYAQMTFDAPIEFVATATTGDPSRCIGLQVNETGAYDLLVRWIFEFTRAF